MGKSKGKEMNIVVTGGSGFIGTYLIHELKRLKHKVKIYDKRKSKQYPELCVIGDVRDKEKLIKELNGADIIYNLAAEHHDDVRPISLYYDVNVGGAENIVEGAIKNNIKRIVFTSTVALYGLNARQPDEKSSADPFNDYGRSKYEAELVFREWAKRDVGNSLSIVRPTVIFGENNRGNVFNLLKQISSGKFVMIGTGKNKKSLGYVKNIALFLSSFLDGEKGTNTYNYADKPDLTTQEIVDIVNEELGRAKLLNVKIPYVVGLIGGYFCDICSKVIRKKLPISSIRVRKFCANTVISSKKMQNIGFVPTYSLEDGLRSTVKHEFVNK